MMIPNGPNSRHNASEYAFFPVPISDETNRAGTIQRIRISIAKTKSVSIPTTFKRIMDIRCVQVSGFCLDNQREVGKLEPSKSSDANIYYSKSKYLNRVVRSWQCGRTVRAAGWQISTLEAVSRAHDLFYALCVNERCIMSTTQNPSCVCDTNHVSPVDHLFQRSTTFQAPDVAESATIGPGFSDEVLKLRRTSHLWPVYLVNIPAGFDSKSWRTAPPHTKHFKTARMAARVAAMLNCELIENSKDGIVRTWNIRIKAGSGYGVVSIVLRDGTEFKPRDEYDMPIAFIRLDGDRQYVRDIVGQLNARLENCPPEEKRLRAYIARSIHPGDMEPIEPVEQEAKPEPTADELLKRHGLEIHQVNVEQQEKRLKQFHEEIGLIQ